MPKKRSQPPLWLRLTIGLFLVIFVAGSLYCGYLFYATVREIVAQAELPPIPVVQWPSVKAPKASAEEHVASAEPTPQLPDMTPVADVSEQSYQPPPSLPASTDRINVLLLGIDRRGKSGWGYRTDTIIIVTVDQANKTAGMLSIPRDLQLPIPGNGEDRINTANVYGYSKKYPGGGPALLKRTIEVAFDVPIDYYIMVDFSAFVKIVDTLGGIDVNVPSKLHDTMYPDPQPGDPYGYKSIHFDPGWQHMDGQRALEYARSRMSTSDFDRARRQQLILLAIREKALSLNLIPRLPALAATMMDTVKTDMTLDEMVELARLAPKIDMTNIKRRVIQKPMVYGYRRDDGAAVQLPKWDLINPVVADLFNAPVVTPSPVPSPAPPTPTPTLAPIEIEALENLASEGARIAVQNGTSEPNFAARVAATLMEQGFQVVEFGDADRLDYPRTVIVDYTGKTYTLERLVETFQVTPENVRHSANLRSQIDIRVIVGQDFLLSVP
ncbi:MAG: LCP family protein [Anaerolineae bacterium]|jgi:LCP family protein required for cell wall assembly